MKSNYKVSLIINLIVVMLTIFASVMMFTGWKFMQGPEIILESTKLGIFRFFTVQSNLFMGMVSFVFAIKEILIIKGKNYQLTRKDYIWKMMATTSVGLTFIVVFFYLGPISKDGIISLLLNSNLFFHLIIPVLSIINFIVFEKNNLLKFKDIVYGIIPTVFYEVYYLINVLIHMENGKVAPKYDWYWFLQNGVWTGVIVVPLILLITYGISLLLWKLNRTK